VYFAPFGGNCRVKLGLKEVPNRFENGSFGPFPGKKKGMHYAGDFSGRGSHKPGGKPAINLPGGVFDVAAGGHFGIATGSGRSELCKKL
jgi:hypothetical protein